MKSEMNTKNIVRLSNEMNSPVLLFGHSIKNIICFIDQNLLPKYEIKMLSRKDFMINYNA